MLRNKLESNRLDADYTEDLVGFALESFLTMLSFPVRRFSIEPFSRRKERWLGADARLHGTMRGFRPFYMQFKRPAAYPDFSESKIIINRKQLKLEVAPLSLFFPLRKKTANQRDFQHNVLLRLRQHLLNRKIGDAAYVCPLFLDRSAYRINMHWAGISRWLRFWERNPWYLEEALLNDQGRKIRFDRIPVLAEHITIPPHDKVSSAAHSYSFTDSGTDLCFHSPLSLQEHSTSLAEFLKRISDGFLERGEKFRLENAMIELRQLVDFVTNSDDRQVSISYDAIDIGDPIVSWFAWGDYLRKEFGIEQFAFVSWSD
jgi:hypothetical protein